MVAWQWIGRVGKASGLQGLFMVSGRTSLLERPSPHLRIGNSLDSAKDCQLVDYQIKSGRAYLKLSQTSDRTSVEALMGLDLWQQAEETDELIARRVISITGEYLGQVSSLYNCGASDIITITNDEGDELDLPLVEAYFDLARMTKEPHLYLKFEADTFSDLWQKQR